MMSSTARAAGLIGGLCLLVAPGCVDAGAVGEEQRIDWLIQTSVENQAYRGPDFVQLNTESFPTALSDSDRVNVFVSADDASDFWQIDPDRQGSAVELAPHAVIVREVVAAGVVRKLTVMVRGTDGYFPDGGDYCYAVLDAAGARFVEDDSGQPLHGRVSECAGCHADRAGDGFLFGVPADYRVGQLP